MQVSKEDNAIAACNQGSVDFADGDKERQW